MDGVLYESSDEKEIPMLSEGNTYMMDFKGDEEGHIVEISFNQVKA